MPALVATRKPLAVSCCIVASLALVPARAASEAPAPPPAAETSPAPSSPGDAKEIIDTAKLKQGTCKKGDLQMPDGCLTLPVLQKKIPPKYPDDARRAHVNGRITAVATVGVDGKVTEVTIVTAEPPRRGFEESTKDAVRQWVYTPATLKGRPVAVLFTVMTEYTVSGGRLPVGRPASER
jgi:TonB family protein